MAICIPTRALHVADAVFKHCPLAGMLILQDCWLTDSALMIEIHSIMDCWLPRHVHVCTGHMPLWTQQQGRTGASTTVNDALDEPLHATEHSQRPPKSQNAKQTSLICLLHAERSEPGMHVSALQQQRSCAFCAMPLQD